MGTYNLLRHNRPTNAYFVLNAAKDRDGTTPARRQKGWTDFDIFAALARREWLEDRQTGPRGGRRWHATRKGRYHLAKARHAIESAEGGAA